jgi:hypothetical protein
MIGEEQTSAPSPFRAVLSPDVVGGLWLDAACAAVFEAWRNEQLRPTVNRDLLVRYLWLWRGLGLPEIQVRRWSWWFTSAATASFLADDLSESSSAAECCSKLALLSGAGRVIHRGASPPLKPPVQWQSAADFLCSRASPPG